jgi:hypothetical protein
MARPWSSGSKSASIMAWSACRAACFKRLPKRPPPGAALSINYPFNVQPKVGHDSIDQRCT